MIFQQILLFLAGCGFGIVSRFVYALVTKIEKAVNLFAITIIFDILMVGVGVTAFSIMLFLICDGIFMPFVFIASIIGYISASFIV